MLLFRRQTLQKLIDLSKKFRKIQDFDKTNQKSAQLKEIVKISTIKNSTYILFTGFITICFLFQPVWKGGVPFNCYIPNGYVVLIFLSGVINLSCAYAFGVGWSVVFHAITLEIFVQFGLLGDKFKMLWAQKPDQRVKKAVKELVDYHNFLLK